MNIRDKVLLVEDERTIRSFMQAILTANGYDVLMAGTGAMANTMIASHCPDIIILDLGLPDMDGMTILRNVRKWSKVPILVVSARSHERDKVEALDAGADDYLTKPFDTKELLARIAVRLREKSSPRLSPVYTYEELTIDTASHSVCVAGKQINLTRTEYAILKLLMQNPEQVIAKSVLLDCISMDTPDCTENSLKTHISHLRSKLREVSGKHRPFIWT